MLVYRKSDQLPETQPHCSDPTWIKNESARFECIQRLIGCCN